MRSQAAIFLVALLVLALGDGTKASAQVVTSTADSGPGTLRSAITNAANGAVITFATNLSGATITLANTLTINTNLTIDASALTGGIQINGSASVQIFNVASGTTDVLNSLTITNGYVPENVDDGGGAGIYNNGTLTMNQCTLSGNDADGYNNGGDGGGIYNDVDGTLTLNRCTLSGNVTYIEGGGIYNLGTLTVNQSTLSGNSAGVGGGIASYQGATLTLNQCTLSGNDASYDQGGGIDNGSTLTLNQCTLSGNSCPYGEGGGINSGGTLTVNECTLSGNSAYNGGGIFAGMVALTNSIVAGNSASSGADIYDFYTLSYGGSNIIQSVTNVNGATVIGPASLTNAPDLAPLGNYGGPTQTMPPLPGSPAIGAGSVTANTFTTDQRGYPRTQNGLIDIGAVELAPFSPVVTNLADAGVGTLRQAIVFSTNGTTITFALNLSGGTITLASTLAINTNLTIDASALPGGIQINGNGSVQIFNVPSGTTDILNSLTIANGRGGLGGGIYGDGTLTLNNCTISGNNAVYGGGILNDVNGTLTVNQCTLIGNNAHSVEAEFIIGGLGGGICNFGTLTVNQSTLSGNNVDIDGGGIYNNATLSLFNTIVAGNSASAGADIGSSSFACIGANIVQNYYGTITGPTPINADPELATLANYGGPTQTMPPLPGSPAIGAGSGAVNTFATDQRGYPRTQNGLIDIGAVELPTIQFTASPTNDWLPNPVQFNCPVVDSDGTPIAQWNWNFGDGAISIVENPTHIYYVDGVFTPVITVTNSLGLTLAASGPAIFTSGNELVTTTNDSGYGSLRQAICNAYGNVIITFAPNLSGATITLQSTLTINTNLTIDASALPGGIQINGNGSVEIFNVASGTTDVLNSLTIIQGHTIGDGGGIYNDAGSLTLNQCTLFGNASITSFVVTYAYGGGIYNEGTLTLNECTLSGNGASGEGGGIANFGTLAVNQSTLTGNSASGEGGGIASFGVLTVSQSTLSGNNAAGGGAIFSQSPMTVNQSTISMNNASGAGGGIWGYYCVCPLTNSIVAGNSSGFDADIYAENSQFVCGGANIVQNYFGSFVGSSPINAAPTLASLGNYGGPTQTMPPLPGSPAIGAGSVAGNTFATDQRGYPRTQYGLIDIGAVELPTIQFTASPTNDWMPDPVQFNCPGVDSDGSAITQWNWSFGDHKVSTLQNPLHIYAGIGSFAPSLTVTNNLGLTLAASGPSVVTTYTQPKIQPITDTRGNFTFSWNTVSNNPAAVYQLQYTTNLIRANWINLGGVISGIDPALTMADTSPTNRQRFYRLAAAMGENIFQETFDPTIGTGIGISYDGGDLLNPTVGVVSGAGISGLPALQIKCSATNGPNGYTYLAGQWQDPNVSGNTDTNLGDYYLSFDAYVTGDASHQAGGGFALQVQEGAGANFSTTFPQGQLQTYQAYQGGSDLLVPQSGVWKHFTINLGGSQFQSPNGTNITFNPTGGSWQLIFQLNSLDWGSEPQTNSTLVIDNIALTILPP